ncbi:MAG: Pimeloyl-[acyl-carrier protein] methyl ester esterase [Gammaproteobacteria bacterium]|nr:Pimeloyl-[acyl-carrier protein] methyl ester esterase [Gammaproteobacteria bacterium]
MELSMSSPPAFDDPAPDEAHTDVCLVHGWGFGPQVWAPLLPRLPAHWRVHVLRLPGYGGEPEPLADADLDDQVDSLLAQAPPGRSAWIGWSLGGMAAMQLAWRQPHRVERLMLLATNARFAAAPDWPAGVPAADVAAIAALLERTDVPTALHYFARLIARGGADSEAVQRQLEARGYQGPAPSKKTLRVGLDLLARSDLRAACAALLPPAIAVAGDRDPLVPLSAIDRMRVLNPRLRILIAQGAGHALFLTHPQVVAEAAAADLQP